LLAPSCDRQLFRANAGRLTNFGGFSQLFTKPNEHPMGAEVEVVLDHSREPDNDIGFKLPCGGPGPHSAVLPVLCSSLVGGEMRAAWTEPATR
jgi:hypothetical protein